MKNLMIDTTLRHNSSFIINFDVCILAGNFFFILMIFMYNLIIPFLWIILKLISNMQPHPQGSVEFVYTARQQPFNFFTEMVITASCDNYIHSYRLR